MITSIATFEEPLQMFGSKIRKHAAVFRDLFCNRLRRLQNLGRNEYTSRPWRCLQWKVVNNGAGVLNKTVDTFITEQ